MNRSCYEFPLDVDHDDYPMVEPIVASILRHGGEWSNFAQSFAALVRRAVDEVIDTARTNRFTLSETEKTEKTYLGTKIEILFRAMLALPKGRTLDLSIDGADVDVKNTMGGVNWAIPEEAVGRLCVLISESERLAVCSVGVIAAREAYLSSGRNRDRKRTISKSGKTNTWWILRNYPYPINVWEKLSLDSREAIMEAPGGTQRVAALFRLLQGRPIARSTVEHVAQQKDAMKRVRRNGGARDLLSPEGIAILYGSADKAIIEKLCLGPVAKDQFISHSPRNEDERCILREFGHID